MLNNIEQGDEVIMEEVLLSIIMPCYNVADTIARALDSVFMQEVDFPYEVIIVDDASTDNSSLLFEAYQKMHNQIKIIRHAENMRNARSFYDGLCAAQGDYFCVLDGDDYYTIRNKLQRQIDFFRNDTQEDYVATAHYHILDLGDGKINIPPTFGFNEFTYADFLTMNAGYFHTATYMYRNIFRDHVPEYFKEELYRGDTPRTTFHLMYSHKKIKVLNYIGSAYTFHYNGIWSKMNQKQQCEYQVKYLTRHKERVRTEFEIQGIEEQKKLFESQLAQSSEQIRDYNSNNFDEALVAAQKYASIFAYRQLDFMLEGAYYSEYIDSLCASLGFIYLVWNPDNIQTKTIQGNIAIVLGELRPKGGGIFQELTELISFYEDQHVFLFVTNMDEIPEETTRILSQYTNLKIVFMSSKKDNRLAYYMHAVKQCAPEKAYVYASHNDTYAQAIMQSAMCKRICLFSFDHGYLCGITNPNYDCYIAKRPCDYAMLKKKLGEAVVYIPTWNVMKTLGEKCEGYKPFVEHTRLITACAAARYYKVDGNAPYSYLDYIISLLKKTNGTHYHFGTIPGEKLAMIRERLGANGIQQEAFVNIPWADDLGQALIDGHVDVFIEPFPIVSYKISLEVMARGIPVAAFYGFRRMETPDFLYPAPILWRNQEEFIQKLTGLTAEELQAHSARSLRHFNDNHCMQTVSPYFRDEQSLPVPKATPVTDGTLCDVKDYFRLFGKENASLNIWQAVEVSIKDSWIKESLKKWDRYLRESREHWAKKGPLGVMRYNSVLLLSPYTIYMKLMK